MLEPWKKIFLLSVGLDEAVVFFLVEPFDDAFAHLWSLLSEKHRLCSGILAKKKAEPLPTLPLGSDANTVLSGNVICLRTSIPERIRGISDAEIP